MQKFNTGLKLYSFAKEKAKEMGLDSSAMKMDSLIHLIQEKEGHSPCFRRQNHCPELTCCWQAACGAVMRKDS